MFPKRLLAKLTVLTVLSFVLVFHARSVAAWGGGCVIFDDGSLGCIEEMGCKMVTVWSTPNDYVNLCVEETPPASHWWWPF